MASELFLRYEEDFQEADRKARETVQRLELTLTQDSPSYKPPPVSGPNSRPQLLQNLQQNVSALRDIVSNMSLECNVVEPAGVREEVKSRVEDYRRATALLEKDLALLRKKSRDADRFDLVSCGNAELDDDTVEERTRMLGSTDKLRGGTSTLYKAEALLNTTNTIGGEALTALRMQTETIQHIHSTTQEVDAEVIDARRIVRQIRQTALRNKILIIVAIVLTIATFILMMFVS
ncbi:putative Vesicle transport v SNARE protein N terminus [Trypanosoma vivax]|nr:vesicle transport v-SNARE 11 [Trypanosoma vivax]KAH8608954.1 putative Vesicle transport v SNARE protein N terminus [Trypanosoma vivax]